MNSIWRFYKDESRQWRWQQVSVSRVVLSESSRGYAAYEACIADAEGQGYVYVAPKDKPARPRAR
ncbi:MAG: hypothetical protein ACREUX_25005 [Burkholderiales bacterium]|jgi:hypothetical protein|nr:DUF1508 domain-containing protein [Betaproteobacteria bacterium]